MSNVRVLVSQRDFANGAVSVHQSLRELLPLLCLGVLPRLAAVDDPKQRRTLPG